MPLIEFAVITGGAAYLLSTVLPLLVMFITGDWTV